MRNSMDSGFNEMKDVKGRRGIRDGSEEVGLIEGPNRLKLNKAEDRSNSEPPRSFSSYLPVAASSNRLKTIRERNTEDAQGSSDEDGELSKSNSQLNESDLDIEIPDSASVSVSQTPTPTPLPLSSSHARRINSETNLNDSKRRLSGFMGNNSKRFCASTSELSFATHLDTRKSLFSPKNNALSRQSFNSSLYGSNMSLNSTNSRLFLVNSPFYNGKTTFGGASAYPKRDINQHKILRNPVQMRPSSSLSNSSNTSAKSDSVLPESNAAKRILEIMNQFSGPLKEARNMGNSINSIIKIPSLIQNRKRFCDDELNLNRSISLSSPANPYGRPMKDSSRMEQQSSLTINSSSIKPLQIPTMSQLLQMKRLQNNTERVREIANRSDSFLNQNHEYKLPSTGNEPRNELKTSKPTSASSSSSSLKMKNNITKGLLRHDKNAINDQLPALPVNLPNVQLPELKSIPKFNIQMSSAATKTLCSSSETITTSKLTTINSPKPAIQFNYTAKSSPIENSSRFVAKKSDFILSKPLSAIEDDEAIDVRNLHHVADKFVFSKPTLIDVSDKIVAPSSSSFFSTPATDNLFKNLVAAQKSSTWECDSCLTRNDSEKTKCLCCDTAKPGDSKTKTIPASPPPKADDLFKNLAAQQKKSQWECDACMTKNDVGKDKCLCCETPKAGSNKKSTTAATTSSINSSFKFGMPSTTSTTADDLFKSLAAKQKQSQWECDACMTRNAADKTECACCSTPKSGSKPAPPPSSTIDSTSKFTFGIKPSNDSEFKKIVAKQSSTWECSACMTRNQPSEKKCVSCEQERMEKNVSSSSFCFGSKMSSSVSLPAPSEVKFSFGMPATVPQSVPETKKDEIIVVSTKSDEVDKPNPTPPMFSFGKISEPIKETSVPTLSFTATPTAVSIVPQTPVSSAKQQEQPEKAEEKKKEEPAPVKTTPVVTFGQNEDKTTTATKTTEANKVELGGFKFSTVSTLPKSDPPPTFGSSLNKNGGFSFGGFSSSPKPTIATTTAVFGSSTAQTTPAFGGQVNTSASGGFSFSGIKKDETTSSSNQLQQQPQPSSIFAFGSNPTMPNSAPMLFGANQAIGNATPVFGASSTQSFSASSNNINNNNESGFGSKMPAFGSSPNQPQKRTFESASSVNSTPAANAMSEVPQGKKFNFGAHTTTNSSSPFQFNAQQQTNDNKPAFNFSANSAPSFNFSNSTLNNNNNPQTPASAPVMQFGTGITQQMPIPFSAQGTGSAAAANQRKILRASRRTTTRR
ncbi:CLUMA_CG001488, isoform B [Clunio marinus]|uniref:Nuclear pore complex protein Nup153 n=1 Tax=Clunio marinus TaxID=568069 RepID=A0A1J1HJG1_9DIPT|nr:CLUMA_CG001488, isoform B [Clunio marinus]